jgi:hypothetical protein
VILGGDFNHQEMMAGRGTAGLRQMNRREASAWHSMTLKYGLSDTWRLNSFKKLSKKEFTFDNGRPGASSTLSWIDKFLVSQSVEERGGRIEAAALVRKLSDYSPLVISVWGKHLDAPRNLPCYFDSSFLREVDGRKELRETWVGNHPPPPLPRRTLIGRPSWKPPPAG